MFNIYILYIHIWYLNVFKTSHAMDNACTSSFITAWILLETSPSRAASLTFRSKLLALLLHISLLEMILGAAYRTVTSHL